MPDTPYSHAGDAELAASSTAGAGTGAAAVQSTRSGRRTSARNLADTTDREDSKQQEEDEAVQAGDVEEREVADKCDWCKKDPKEATRHCLDCPENSDLYCQLCFEKTHNTGLNSSHVSQALLEFGYDVDKFDETEINDVREEGKA